ncbi:MAG: voltage-gated ClC-type chloride channel ClcB [Betaproteobacteria bacterium]|nr:voltage-gated ClC-type chloride channel ClcB [Betaproteobacteria bacterium]
MSLFWRGPLRLARRVLGIPRAPWADLVMALTVGSVGALVVEGFRAVLFRLEALFVGASGGHLVSAARDLVPEARFFAPALGALVAGLVLWLAERGRPPTPWRRSGDYIEAVSIGNGRLDLTGGMLKAIASLLVVSTGGAVGREGAMVLLAAMAASVLGRIAGRQFELRLVVSCGAAAGLAAAYHAPLAGAMFVAELLLGSLALAQLGPVIVAAVVSHGITTLIVGQTSLFEIGPLAAPGVAQAGPLVAMGLVAAIVGAAVLYWLDGVRKLYARIALPLPLAFALGGLVVGTLSLWRPEVWGNGYSTTARFLVDPPVWHVVAAILVLKVIAIAATTGSGAPGGVFTPTLFVGAAFGLLTAAALNALGLPVASTPVYVLFGMATVLAATTHAPVMAALMVFEMARQYALLTTLLPACVIAALVARRLHARSVYGLAATP